MWICMIFNYIKLRTKVVCTYVVSHHIICQPGASFCPCQANGGERERQTERESERQLSPTRPVTTRRTFSGDKVLQKLLKMCCKCIGKSLPFSGGLSSYGILSFLLPSTITCSLHRTHPHTHNAINCDK